MTAPVGSVTVPVREAVSCPGRLGEIASTRRKITSGSRRDCILAPHLEPYIPKGGPGLRPVHFEGIDFCGADIAGEQRRIVGRKSKPVHERSSGHASDI